MLKLKFPSTVYQDGTILILRYRKHIQKQINLNNFLTFSEIYPISLSNFIYTTSALSDMQQLSLEQLNSLLQIKSIINSIQTLASTYNLKIQNKYHNFTKIYH